MADFLTPEQRSQRMAAVKQRDTPPEVALRRALHRLGFRFRAHVRQLPGTPDVVLPKYKTVVFVHGCFWHRHPGCNRTTTPSSNQSFWLEKFRRNVERDAEQISQLKKMGWHVHVVWQCELSTPRRVSEMASLLALKLREETVAPVLSVSYRTKVD